MFICCEIQHTFTLQQGISTWINVGFKSHVQLYIHGMSHENLQVWRKIKCPLYMVCIHSLYLVNRATAYCRRGGVIWNGSSVELGLANSSWPQTPGRRDWKGTLGHTHDCILMVAKQSRSCSRIHLLPSLHFLVVSTCSFPDGHFLMVSGYLTTRMPKYLWVQITL